MIDIKPGSPIEVEITRVPNNEAGTKTLIRLCRKDPRIVRHDRTQQRKRPSLEEWRRGGMTWHHQMKTKPAFSLVVGAKYALRATVDVLRDLNSIERFVRVSPAQSGK